MKIGVTGHQNLPSQNIWDWVEYELTKLMSTIKDPIGLTSLAIGADQLFARIVLDQGGKIQVLIPFPNYETTFKKITDLESYKELLGKAYIVETLQSKASDEESYLAAGQRVVEVCDLLVAVWNGEKARGVGGTGDIVEYAKSGGKKVIHLNTKSCNIDGDIINLL